MRSMRDSNMNPQAASVFSGVSEAEIKNQVADIVRKKAKILAAAPEDLKEVLGQRIDWLDKKYNEKVAGNRPDYVGKPIPDRVKPPDHLVKQAKEFLPTLSKKAKVMIEAYTSDGYIDLNEDMRKCPPDYKCLDDSQIEMYGAIESAIEKAPAFVEPVPVYRGIGSLKPEIREQLLQTFQNSLDSGQPCQLNCITSTTVDPGRMGMFLDNPRPDRSMAFHIVARKGLYVDPISFSEGEREVIMSAHARYKVVGIADARYERSYGAVTHKVVYLEQIV